MGQPYVYRFWVETGGGTGVFLDEQAVPGQVSARALAAGDLDGDGDLDLAVADFGANSESAPWRREIGAGMETWTWRPLTTDPTVFIF